MTAKQSLIDFLEIRVEALEKEVKELNRDLNLHCSTLESTIKGLEAELKLENEKFRIKLINTRKKQRCITLNQKEEWKAYQRA